MEEKSSSLLSKIKSNFFLKELLCLAFGEMKPIIKLVRYNKSLLNRLNINIKENYNYKIITKLEKNICSLFIFCLLLIETIIFLLFLPYVIKFYISGKFNEKNLKDRYNLKIKTFIDFMDNYILFAYFLFTIISLIFLIIYFFCKSFALK